ncbi:MAG: hypothetical protein ACRDRU_19745 [Pseudonocardiaceae bacterium]
MDTPRNFTAAVHQEEDWYVAQCLEVDVASQGQTIPEVLRKVIRVIGSLGFIHVRTKGSHAV